MVNKLHWGILGLDHIADEFAHMLEKRNATYTIACEALEQKEAFLKKHNVRKAYDTTSAMLTDELIDIVYISTMASEHFRNIMDCLKHGKHVFCEKPMFTNAKEASEAYAFARAQKLFISEANTLFYMPLYEKIKTSIAEGVIGQLKMVHVEFGSLKQEDADCPIYQKDKAGGAMYDIGIYALTAALSYIKGNIIACMATEIKHSFGIDEQWNIGICSEKKELASINLSIRSKLPKTLVIAGDKAYFEIENYPRADKAVLVLPDGRRETICCGNCECAVLYEIETVEQQLLAGCWENIECTSITQRVMKLMDEVKERRYCV